eukprot:Gb_22200 [translate_table: standard]
MAAAIAAALTLVNQTPFVFGSHQNNYNCSTTTTNSAQKLPVKCRFHRMCATPTPLGLGDLTTPRAFEFGGVEPDLSEEPIDNVSIPGVSEEDFPYGYADGAHTWHEGDNGIAKYGNTSNSTFSFHDFHGFNQAAIIYHTMHAVWAWPKFHPSGITVQPHNNMPFKGNIHSLNNCNCYFTGLFAALLRILSPNLGLMCHSRLNMVGADRFVGWYNLLLSPIGLYDIPRGW